MEKIKYVDFLVFGGLGIVEISASEKGLISVLFIDTPPKTVSPSHFTSLCKIQLIEYLNGERSNFDLKLVLEGTEFQLMVWKELQRIPYGKTKTYGEIASTIGMNKSTRAIGAANRKNKFRIIVPCHRIVGCDNKLKGYIHGLWRKEWLLKHEGCKDKLPSEGKIKFLDK